MSWSKRELLLKAFSELALAGYAFDLDPDEIQDELNSLDTMMAEWTGWGIHVSYPLPNSPGDSDPDQSSNLPAFAVRPVYMNLAIAIAASNGKTLMPQQMVIAKDGYDLLLAQASAPCSTQYPSTLPMGAGNRRMNNMTGRVFFPIPDTGPTGVVDGSFVLEK